MTMIILQCFWLIFVCVQGYVFYSNKKRRKRMSEQMMQDMSTYMSEGYKYVYDELYVPLMPVFVEDEQKRVWLNTEVVRIEQHMMLKFGDEYSSLNMPIERYFTAEFACMAKLKDEDLTQYFKIKEL